MSCRPAQQHKLSEHIVVRTYKDGDHIITQGTPRPMGPTIYIPADGPGRISDGRDLGGGRQPVCWRASSSAHHSRNCHMYSVVVLH